MGADAGGSGGVISIRDQRGSLVKVINIILGIDYTKSNEETGEYLLVGGRCLNPILGNELNPYRKTRK
ncbi:hypothetical protein Pelo_16884 [Pelomyxa schiedti]|nr:hypothetical protein Pelo_16884 [Pelomyxa schiedti]